MPEALGTDERLSFGLLRNTFGASRKLQMLAVDGRCGRESLCLNSDYSRQTQDMVFDVHANAFAVFGGACARGIFYSIETPVDAIFVANDLACNLGSQQMCGYDLVDLVACNLTSCGKKGQVENLAGEI